MNAQPRFLSRDAAAKRLRDEFGRKVTKQYLARAATRGDRAALHACRKEAVYEVEALDAWALAQMSPAVRRAADLRPAPSADENKYGADATN